MNSSTNSFCQICQLDSNKKIDNCSDCNSSQAIVFRERPAQELEPMPLELKVVVKPIAFVLFVIGMPIALVAGISLSRTLKVRCLGALALFVVMLGQFGAGVQLTAAAMAMALTLV